jgi:hypothetical protein
VAAVAEAARRSAQFNRRVSALADRFRDLRAKYGRTVQSFVALSRSYTDSLGLLFPAAHKITVRDPPQVLHAQIAKVQALLRSVFALVPRVKYELPSDVYGLALGLRRVFEGEALPESLGDLTVQITEDQIAQLSAEGSPGLVESLLVHAQQIGAMLNSSIALETVVEMLANQLAITELPPPTDEGMLELFEILQNRLAQMATVKSSFRKYFDSVRSLLDGIAKSLPATLDSIVAELRKPPMID